MEKIQALHLPKVNEVNGANTVKEGGRTPFKTPNGKRMKPPK
jgi:hypothetical protein